MTAPTHRRFSNVIAVLACLLGAAVFVELVTLPLSVDQQAIFASVLVLAAIILRRRRVSRIGSLTMIALAMVVSSRYAWWRVTHTLQFDSLLEAFLGIGLLVAELYAFIVLVLGFFQVLWPLERKPVPLPSDRAQWPSVDVFIPTYNESLDVVRTTIMAALELDWPDEKLNVYVLDDGRREAFRDFCAQIGCGYLIRDNNAHAKAGNINAALARTQGEYIAVFDCDHIPTRSFLQICMGWFGRDPKLALLQTPHYFFSPDPFERNLHTFGKVPNEGALFYGLLQDGNDLWNASFFCGSCAVLKRGPCLDVGGVAVETVTEDAHTALKLHRAGYNSAYLAIPQAAGLATESLSSHVGQRIRWARGMAQICRIDNPLRGKGLNLPQRLCYLNAMLHFFYGLPRLIYLTAPLAYLLFGARVIHASALMIIVFALPHIIHANLTNSRLQGRFRHLFWNEVYESVLAWYILWPTLASVINPRLGKFNVTAKGGLVERGYFDRQIAKPYLFLLLLNVAGLVAAGLRLFYFGDTGQLHTVLLNVGWTFYNMVILGASIAAASETRQVRRAHRVVFHLPVRVQLDDGRFADADMMDFSTSGMALRLQHKQQLAKGAGLRIEMRRGDERHWLPANVVRAGDEGVHVAFDTLDMAQERWLVSCTFARADIWAGRWGELRPDAPLRSLGHIISAGLLGFRRLGGYIVHSAARGPRNLSPEPHSSRESNS